MAPYFDISVDVARDLVRIRMGGFFTTDDIARFVVARDAAHGQLHCAPNQHMTLNDVRQMDIQTQESVLAFQAVLANPRHRSRKLAFIHASTLARMQLRRAAANRAVEYFATVEEAERWLFSAEDLSDRAALPA